MGTQSSCTTPGNDNNKPAFVFVFSTFHQCTTAGLAVGSAAVEHNTNQTASNIGKDVRKASSTNTTDGWFRPTGVLHTQESFACLLSIALYHVHVSAVFSSGWGCQKLSRLQSGKGCIALGYFLWVECLYYIGMGFLIEYFSLFLTRTLIVFRKRPLICARNNGVSAVVDATKDQTAAAPFPFPGYLSANTIDLSVVMHHHQRWYSRLTYRGVSR